MGLGFWFVTTQSQESSSLQDSFLQPQQSAPKLDHPLSIELQRQREYPASQITRVRQLSGGSTYQRWLVRFMVEDLEQFGILTIPVAEQPANGWPVIVFNHGYIPPEQWNNTTRYQAYVDFLARNNFVVLMPDYRGHGNSEGLPTGGYFSDGYTTDVLVATASLAQLPEVDSDRIGMWGHSMGGHLTLRVLTIRPDQIQAAVIWAGVVAPYQRMFEYWNSRQSDWQPSPRERQANRPSSQNIQDTFGSPALNTEFWKAISPYTYLADITAPVQLHHGTADTEVPVSFSQLLAEDLQNLDKTIEYFEYQGGDHNLSGASFTPAFTRTVEFFKANL